MTVRPACESAHRTPPGLDGAVGLDDPLVAEILRALGRCARDPGPADAVFVDAAGRLLAAHRLRERGGERSQVVQPPRREQPLAPVTVARIKEFVDGSMVRSLRVTELAAVAGLSVAHFSRAFRLATGETPHAFTLRLRLERAEQLLRRDDLGLTETALATGFSSQSHFTTQYRRARGMTPGEYRRQARG